MKELATKIVEFITKHEICDLLQLKPILKAYENEDYETVLATARGSLDWLWDEGFEITDELLNGRAIRWNENEQIRWERHYKDGDFDGLGRGWNKDGKLWWERYYINGVLTKL